MKKPTKRTRLVRGRDFCGWKWETGDGELSQAVEAHRIKPTTRIALAGKWVRVKFVKV